jgi:hypothetical protein
MPPRKQRSLYDLAGALALNVDETCRVTGLGEKLILAEIQARRLKARTISRRRIILVSDLRDWLNGLPEAGYHTDHAPLRHRRDSRRW